MTDAMRMPMSIRFGQDYWAALGDANDESLRVFRKETSQWMKRKGEAVEMAHQIASDE